MTRLFNLTLSGNRHHRISAIAEIKASSCLQLGHDSEGVVLTAFDLRIADGVADRAATLALVGAERDADVSAVAVATQARMIRGALK